MSDVSIEQRIAQIWQDVLNVPQVGVHENFFDLGGDSIFATLVVSRLRNTFGVALPMRCIFETPTVADLAVAVRRERPADPDALRVLDQVESMQPGDLDAVFEPPPAPEGMGFSVFFFSGDATAAERDRYRLVMEAARYADRHGYEAIWTPERHFNTFGGLYPNPAVLGAALAAVTERIGIRGGSVQAALHHPLRIAEEWSVVDNLSDGRVGLAFATGFLSTDFLFAPERFADRRAIMFDTIRTVRQLWRGEPLAMQDGAGRTVDATIFPKPVQPVLPIWLAATRKPETFVQAAELGAGVLTGLIALSMDELAENIALYRRTLAQHGHDPQAGRVTVMLHTYVGESDAAVRATIRAPFRAYLRSHMGAMRPLAASHGIDWDTLTPQDEEALVDAAFERYYRDSLLGDEAKCEAMVERLAAIGVDEVACLIDFGVSVEDAMASLERLTRLKSQVFQV